MDKRSSNVPSFQSLYGGPDPVIITFGDFEIEKICKKNEDVDGIVTDLNDVLKRLGNVLDTMDTSIEHPIEIAIKIIQSKVMEIMTHLSLLNIMQLDMGAFERQVREEVDKHWKEFQKTQFRQIDDIFLTENMKRLIHEGMDECIKELQEKHLKRKEKLLRSQSGGSELQSFQLPPVSGSSGDHSAASEEQVAFKNKTGEESSVPGSSGDHFAASEEQVALKNKIGEEESSVPGSSGDHSAAVEERVPLKITVKKKARFRTQNQMWLVTSTEHLEKKSADSAPKNRN